MTRWDELGWRLRWDVIDAGTQSFKQTEWICPKPTPESDQNHLSVPYQAVSRSQIPVGIGISTVGQWEGKQETGSPTLPR